MKNFVKFGGLIVVAVLLWLGWRQLFPNDELQIKKMLNGLATTLSRGKSSPVSALLALDRVRDCFAPKVDITIDAPGMGKAAFGDREDLMQAIQLAWTRTSGAKVEFFDITAHLGADSQAATSELTVRATQPGSSDVYVQEFKLELKKQDEKWRITRIIPVEVFK